MNVGSRKVLEKAFKLPEANGPRADAERMTFLSLLATDDPSTRATPRLPEITFPNRRLPGENGWARERLEPKRIDE